MKISVYIVLLSVLSTSCLVECPEFDSKLLSWMPRNPGEKVMYVNQDQDTITFVVNTKSMNGQYHIKRSQKEYCGTYGSIRMTDTLAKNSINLEIREQDKRTYFSVEIHLYQENLFSGQMTFEGIECCLDTITINGVTYNEAYSHIQDSTYFDDEINKVVLANDFGIVKFCNKQNGDEWVLNSE